MRPTWLVVYLLTVSQRSNRYPRRDSLTANRKWRCLIWGRGGIGSRQNVRGIIKFSGHLRSLPWGRGAKSWRTYGSKSMTSLSKAWIVCSRGAGIPRFKASRPILQRSRTGNGSLRLSKGGFSDDRAPARKRAKITRPDTAQDHLTSTVVVDFPGRTSSRH